MTNKTRCKICNGLQKGKWNPFGGQSGKHGGQRTIFIGLECQDCGKVEK